MAARDSQVFLGGLDEELKLLLAARLSEAGFPVATEGHKYLGRNPLNICNRGLRGRGAQIELTRDFRGPEYRKVIAPIVRNAITEYLSQPRSKPPPSRPAIEGLLIRLSAI